MINKILPLLLFWVTSCSNTSQPADVAVSYDGNRTVHFIGPITPVSARKFVEVASQIEGQFLLEITSAGGDASSSLDIADIIDKRNVAVAVKNYCMSGCAYVFLAADRKVVERGSVVGFHTTVKSSNDLIEQSFIYHGQRMSGDADKREVALFQKRGISLDILNKADDVLGALCVGSQSSKSPVGDGRSVAFGWKVHSWTLSLEEMGKLGVTNIKGYWPNSQEELNYLYRKHFNAGFSGFYIDDLSSYEDRKPRLPVCF